MASNIEVMEKGISCLLANLGAYETEQFISFINREKFDYTEWQRNKFDNMNSDEFNKAAVEYETQHPFVMKKKF